MKIKYGVINIGDLVSDLNNWDTLYVAGRLQKPIKIIEPEKAVNSANKNNLKSALLTALLLLPESFTEEQLFMVIAKLSYMGDFRMIIGENPNKIQNIVNNNIPYFRDLYVDTISLQSTLHKKGDNLYIQDVRESALISILSGLPNHLKKQIQYQHGLSSSNFEHDIILKKVNIHNAVKNGVINIVRYYSITQSAKGILTAGISRSVIYGLAKLLKMRQ